jgi:thymidylate synthase (FAD)
VKVLDHGYARLVEWWGSDERVVESARMSTGKGFLGWGPACEHCGRPVEPALAHADPTAMKCYGTRERPGCGTVDGKPGDEKLLKFLWEHEHATPFEMAGLTIEAKAPIFVFREWMRHRVPFGYNEMSSRYVPLPDENYVPSVERLLANVGTANKQASAADTAQRPLNDVRAAAFRQELERVYAECERLYRDALDVGVPKELARVCLPVGRYSVMRATSNLRGWLAFCKLRCAPNAQAEIRVYAEAVAVFIGRLFPRTYAVARESVGLP